MVGFGVRNLADLDAGLAEAARVLKPGARFVVLEFTTPRFAPLRAAYLFYFRRVLPVVGRAVSKHTDAYTYLPESVLEFPDPEALAARLGGGRLPRRRLRAADRRDLRHPPWHSITSAPSWARSTRRAICGVWTSPCRSTWRSPRSPTACMKSPGGGPALLFERPSLVQGGPSPYPVAVNLFGSERRMALALGVERLDEIGERIAEMLNIKVPEGLLAKLAMLPRLAEMAKFPPRLVGERPPCQEIVVRGDDVDLGRFPIPVCWPEDGGPYITLPGVITRDPASGTRNVGMYRIQVTGPRTVAMHWQRHKVGAAHWRAMAERGETMPVAIALGGDPASIYAASAPLPPTIDEFLFAGFLRREPVRLARALTCDLEVPAEAEIVLEGYIDPREPLVLEGPFGDHTGFYSLADHYPQVHITAITMRATRCGRTRSWAGRRWRTTGSATPPSGSSSRCSSSRCPRSWTTTCRPRASSTTSCS